MGLTRRRFLTTSAAATAAVAGSAGLAGCGFGKGGSSGGGGSSDAVTFTTWGTDAELAGFKNAIAGFEKANPGTTIALNSVPYEQMFTNIDAQLQAGNPPDMFRVPYYTFGSYAGRDQLLDLSSHLPSGFSDRFTPQAWAAVQGSGKPYGVPHHTDTSVILYDKAAMSKAGVTDIPTSIDKAWTWQQFEAVARKLRTSLPSNHYPFAYNWQGNGVTRWLSWLFEANGRFLSSDLKSAAINAAPGKAAVDFTKGFFSSKLVPPNSSVKATKYAADDWYDSTVAMVFGGAFMLPDAKTTATFDWGATFSPRNVRHGGDFGGNALVITKNTKRADAAIKFLDYLTGADAMKAFCVTASLLPTRKDLVAQGIEFTVRPELSKVFTGQAATVQATDSGQVASPAMSKIITVLKDELEKAFVGGQTTQATLTGLSSGITSAVAG